MKIIIKLILSVGISLHFVIPALAIEFFDINKPGIEKVTIAVIANDSGDIIDPLVGQLEKQLQKTLLSNNSTVLCCASHSIEYSQLKMLGTMF